MNSVLIKLFIELKGLPDSFKNAKENPLFGVIYTAIEGFVFFFVSFVSTVALTTFKMVWAIVRDFSYNLFSDYGPAIIKNVNQGTTWLLDNFQASPVKFSINLYFTFVVTGYMSGFLPLGEDVLVLFCFSAAVLIIYINMRDAFVDALKERQDAIYKDVTSFFVFKKDNLEALKESEESLLTLRQDIITLQDYTKTGLVRLQGSQKSVIQRLVAKEILSQLDAAKVVTSGLQSVLHKQMVVSFRESIVEGCFEPEGTLYYHLSGDMKNNPGLNWYLATQGPLWCKHPKTKHIERV